MKGNYERKWVKDSIFEVEKRKQILIFELILILKLPEAGTIALFIVIRRM